LLHESDEILIVLPRVALAPVDYHGRKLVGAEPKRLPEALDGGRIDDAHPKPVSEPLQELVDVVGKKGEVLPEILGQGGTRLLAMDAISEAHLTERQLAVLTVIENRRRVRDYLYIDRLHGSPRAFKECLPGLLCSRIQNAATHRVQSVAGKARRELQTSRSPLQELDKSGLVEDFDAELFGLG
jgi:hypothetical protein